MLYFIVLKNDIIFSRGGAMKNTTILYSVLLFISLSIFISACGGGSDSTPEPSTITPSPVLTVIDNSNAQLIVKGLFRVLMGAVMGAEPLADLASLTTYTCISESSGIFDTTISLDNNQATLTFDNCFTSYTTHYHGQLIASNPTMNPLGFDVSFNNLNINQMTFGYEFQQTAIMVNGGLSVSLTSTDDSKIYSAQSESLSVITEGGTYTINNFSLTIVKNTGSNITYDIAGLLSSTAFSHSVKISTAIQLLKLPTARYYPSVGKLLLTGQDSYIALSVNGDENFTPQEMQTSLDINNVITNYSWSDIRDWAGVLRTFSARH